MANAELPPAIAQDLEEEHKRHVGLQVAQAQADARRSDEASDSASAAGVPRPLYVKRGSRHYIEIHRIKLRPAEAVFTKDPAGGYEFVGETNARAELPDIPISL